MSWEAFRLTSKSPSELFSVMGPAGVDNLVRQALQECWTSLPEERRDFSAWKKRAGETFARSRRVWSKIKRPTPAAFFHHLAPFPSDGHLRQAMVMCWMMMPRAGGREFKRVVKTMDAIFERNMKSWEQDNKTFASKPTKKVKAKSRSTGSTGKSIRKSTRKTTRKTTRKSK